MSPRALIILAALAGAAGCAASPTVLRPTGIGAVAFGASLAETELMVGEKAADLGADAACRYVEFGSMPGIRFTVVDGVISRADAGPGVRNTLGVALGDTTESVASLYPNVDVRRDGDTVGGSHLVFFDAGGRHAIVLQAAGNKIIGIRAGLGSAVGSPQGCP